MDITFVLATYNLSSPIPRRSGYDQKPPNQFALLTVDEAITDYNINITFIAIASEPRTYQEAIYSPHLKQWESAVQLKFA